VKLSYTQLLCYCVLAANVGVAQVGTTNSPARPDDGWPDISNFLDQKYGFLPVVIPITEPAVGYGAAGGLAFISAPLGGAEAGFGRPNITMVGGMGTANGSWGAVAGDIRHWMDDRVQTLVGAVYSSINLDYYGIGEDSVLAGDPLGYNLEPKGGLVQGKYRLGNSRLWAGLNYAFASTHVSFDAPASTPGLPDYETDSKVGGLTPTLTYDSRDNIFTPNRGSYLELSAGLFSEALGGDDDFQRVRLTGIQYFTLHPRLHLGLRTDLAASFGDAPFYLHPFIYMRGVPAMRYQGEEMAQIEAELRWQFWQRISAVGFIGSGAAWNDFEQFKSTESVVAGGFGFRYELARKYGLHAGVDLAFSEDNTAVYVQFGSAWMRP
jgi:hypothetical protein